MNINCKPNGHRLNFSINIMVHVIFLFTILSGIFIFIISKISSDRINNEITLLFNETINKNIDNIPNEDKKIIKEKIEEYKLNRISELYDKEDKTRYYNNKILKRSIIITLILLIIGLFIVIIISRLLCHKVPLKHIILENIIIFTGIGIMEYAFFNFVILKFIPVEPSFIQETLISSIRNYI